VRICSTSAMLRKRIEEAASLLHNLLGGERYRSLEVSDLFEHRLEIDVARWSLSSRSLARMSETGNFFSFELGARGSGIVAASGAQEGPLDPCQNWTISLGRCTGRLGPMGNQRLEILLWTHSADQGMAEKLDSVGDHLPFRAATSRPFPFPWISA